MGLIILLALFTNWGVVKAETDGYPSVMTLPFLLRFESSPEAMRLDAGFEYVRSIRAAVSLNVHNTTKSQVIASMFSMLLPNVYVLITTRSGVLCNVELGLGLRPVAFDEADIWVVNLGDSTVTKLRASDGKVLATFTAGTGPAAAALDGENMWIANQGSNDVTKLRARDAAALWNLRRR